MRTVIFSHPAARDFDALPAEAREIIAEGIYALAIMNRGDVKKLIGSGDMFRLRIGRYRVLFARTAETIHLLYIGKRETTTYR